MYDTFFGFKHRPFSSVPQADQYFPAATIEAARIALSRCIQRGEGVGVVIGPTGTGKTLLCRMLSEHSKKTFPVAELSCGRLSSRRSLYQAILYGLGQPYRGMDEGELRLSLVDYLTLGKGPHRGMVLIVDEAHTLPLRLLDEIRMLTNLADQGQPLVRLLLAANGSLEERLAGPKMDSFNQRISARCYLEAFNRSETQDYIHAQINATGGCGVDLFPEDACQSIYQATDGVPRLINQLCDHALLVAFVAGRRIIQPANVEEAWADLQQLPTPWNGDAQHEQGGVIEFGRFDDTPDESTRPTAAESPEFPSLRVAEDFEESTAGSFEIGSQSSQTQPGSAAGEDEFQPTGTFTPEIELVLEDTDHPFQEEFEHEEVITDRYAPSDTVSSPVLQSPATETPADQSAECTESSENVVAVEQDAVQTKPRPMSAVRRHEYSRLFAKLRQG